MTTKPRIPWDLKALSKAPTTHPAAGFQANAVKAVFYDGLPWKGKPTRVFAWIGLPKVDPNNRDAKVPAMVLVHGGGGTAFDEWVRLWTARGYAAIAMDTCGCTAGGEHGKRPRHDMGGPPGWGGYDQIDQPVEDQWPYHAVAGVILANSLIRSMPRVDPNRVGITGISWGAFLACIVSGVDERFRFAVPVYGCGFYGEMPTFRAKLQEMGKDRAEKWLKLWDPSVYLPEARMPTLWVTGTNDVAFPLNIVRKSYLLPPGPRTLCIRVRMVHAHGGPGENPEEIRAFADRFRVDGKPLARITGQGGAGGGAWVRYESKSPIVRAELNYTKDAGEWQKREWRTVAARVDADARKVAADLPEGATVYYFNLIDDRDLIVSSEHVGD